MKTKLLIPLAVLLLPLCGCQLARPAQAEPASDRLVGALVTWEPLDLFDAEAHLSDNAGNLQGGTLTAEAADACQQRLYAVAQEVTLTDEHGETYTKTEYQFPDVDGAVLYAALFEDETGNAYVSHSDEAISDCQLDYHSTDDGEAITVSGTVYFSALRQSCGIYANPIYQDSTGTLYAISGSCMKFSPDGTAGETCTITLDQTAAASENETVKSSYAATVSISAESCFPPEELVLQQMDADGSVLSRKSCDIHALPDEIALDPAAAYVIVETHSRDASGNAVISRELYEKGDESIPVMCPQEDGVLIQSQHTLQFS